MFGLDSKQMLSFLGSKNTNLKLEIEPHRKHPRGVATPLAAQLVRGFTGPQRRSGQAVRGSRVPSLLLLLRGVLGLQFDRASYLYIGFSIPAARRFASNIYQVQ